MKAKGRGLVCKTGWQSSRTTRAITRTSSNKTPKYCLKTTQQSYSPPELADCRVCSKAEEIWTSHSNVKTVEGVLSTQRAFLSNLPNVRHNYSLFFWYSLIKDTRISLGVVARCCDEVRIWSWLHPPVHNLASCYRLLSSTLLVPLLQ